MTKSDENVLENFERKVLWTTLAYREEDTIFGLMNCTVWTRHYNIDKESEYCAGLVIWKDEEQNLKKSPNTMTVDLEDSRKYDGSTVLIVK